MAGGQHCVEDINVDKLLVKYDWSVDISNDMRNADEANHLIQILHENLPNRCSIIIASWLISSRGFVSVKFPSHLSLLLTAGVRIYSLYE